MNPSKLRHRVKLLSQQTTVNEAGEHVTDWAENKTIWAHVAPLSVKDILAAQGSGNKTVARCTVRYQTGITSGMRILHNGQQYHINGDPIPDAQTGRESLTLMLESVL